MTPTTELGQGLCLLYIPFAVVFVSTQLGGIADAVMNPGGEEGGLARLMKMDFSLEAMLAMDEDGDGDVSEFEFLKFMLTTAELVDEAALDALHDTFCPLDADGSGSLDRDDLVTEPLGIPRGEDGMLAANLVEKHQLSFGDIVGGLKRGTITKVQELAKEIESTEAFLVTKSDDGAEERKEEEHDDDDDDVAIPSGGSRSSRSEGRGMSAPLLPGGSKKQSSSSSSSADDVRGGDGGIPKPSAGGSSKKQAPQREGRRYQSSSSSSLKASSTSDLSFADSGKADPIARSRRESNKPSSKASNGSSVHGPAYNYAGGGGGGGGRGKAGSKPGSRSHSPPTGVVLSLDEEGSAPEVRDVGGGLSLDD